MPTLPWFFAAPKNHSESNRNLGKPGRERHMFAKKINVGPKPNPKVHPLPMFGYKYGNQKEPNEDQEGAPKETKWWPKATKWEPKVTKR